MKVESTSYSTIHKWLARHHKKTGACTFCSSNKKTQWALKRGCSHAKDIGCYIELCISCHIKYDYTEERRAHASKVMMGRRVTWGLRPVKATLGADTLRFESIRAAARHFNIYPEAIQLVLRGKNLTAAKHTWEYDN